MTDWTPTCVLCARRGRKRPPDSGHLCVDCATALSRMLNQILALVTDAAAFVEPVQRTGGGRTVPGSRPPLNVEALDPESVDVVRWPGDDHPPTLLGVLEDWERMIREERRMSPYGPASLARAARRSHAAARNHTGVSPTTPRDSEPATARTASPGIVTITGVIRFLRAQIAWIINTPTFPVEDFHDELIDCLRAAKRWDLAAADNGRWRVDCPAIRDNGQPCGARISIDTDSIEGDVQCRRCRSTWSVAWLMRVAGTDDTWADPEALAQHFRVGVSTLRRWAAQGHVARRNGLYRWADVERCATHRDAAEG